MSYYLAIDIGASSGRHIIGWQENGEIKTEEIYRFYNGVEKENGHLIWNIENLWKEVKAGIKIGFEKYSEIKSLSIDTWGVDYVLLNGEEEILPCFAYRDLRTEKVIDKLHSIVPFSELYSHTGCQFQPFNTIYQLFDDKLSGKLDNATDMLHIPEYLMYKLTGVKAREYTNATTTGLIDAKGGEFDLELIEKIGLPKVLFPKLSQPKTKLGKFLPEIEKEVGGNCEVVLCATHDTGSAVEGIPMEGVAPYISSGTWSLLGVKTPAPITNKKSMDANYSNEGGVGYNRYQKNIMGMWIVNNLKKELCPDMEFKAIDQAAKESLCDTLVDANSTEFLSPESMKGAFDKATNGKLETVGDYFRCAYLSLAYSYKEALEELERNTGKVYDSLYIVGGGAKNKVLNKMTEEITGKKVIALPIEATALGNLKIQMEA